MSVRMRHTRAHTGNRRAHHKVDVPRLSTCQKCDATYVRHTACLNCGSYRGREVIDMKAQLAKKAERQKRKADALREQGLTSAEEHTGKSKEDLDAEALSHTNDSGKK